MWRYKLILFLFFVSAGLFAQEPADSLLFVRYAGTFGSMIPDRTVPNEIDRYTRDSIWQKYAYGHQVKVQRFQKEFTKEGEKEKRIGINYIRFDFIGNVESIKHFSADSVLNVDWQVDYFAGSAPELITYDYMHGFRIDSTRFRYNRAGQIQSVCIHTVKNRFDTAACDQRMYDHNGRIMVLQNARYGPLAGTYTYEYDKKGRLIRRAFSDRTNGVVLCTDTIEYILLDSAGRYELRKHAIRITGKNFWIPVEEMRIDHKIERIIQYDLFVSAYSRKFDQLGSVSIVFTYDASGNRLSQTIKNSDDSRMLIFGSGAYTDTITTYRLAEEKNGTRKILQTQCIEYYDKNGLLQKRTTSYYLTERKKKKWTSRIREVETELYSWEPY